MPESVADTGVIIIVLSCICLFLIGLLAYLYLRLKRNQTPSQTTAEHLQLLYLKSQESLLKAITTGQPFKRCASDFANSLKDTFQIERMALYIRNRQRFVPIIWNGIDQPGINRLYFSANLEFIKKLAHEAKPLSFDNFEPSDNLGRLLHQKLHMRIVLPVATGSNLNGLLVVSESASYDINELAPYLLALADVLSHASEISRKTNFQPPPPKPTHENNRKPGAELLYEVNNRMLKLYNEKPLLETFQDILRKYIRPSFMFVFMPVDHKNQMRVRYGSGPVPDQVRDFNLNRQEGVVNLLSRQHGIHRLNHVEEALGRDPLLQVFKEAGVQLLTGLSLPGRRCAVMGLGEKRSRPGFYNRDDLNMLNALSQTLRMTLYNIYQFNRIEELSYTDHMTGLYNYRYFYKRLAEEIMRARRFNHDLALVIFDIDGFKEFNDKYGHQAGDNILKQLGRLVEDSVRTIDILSRYGGDEFCLVMPETGLEACEQFMERLRKKIENHPFRNRFNNQSLGIHISMGGALYPTHAERADRLIYCADMALMEAKQTGRNKISIYDSSLEKKNAK